MLLLMMRDKQHSLISRAPERLEKVAHIKGNRYPHPSRLEG